MDGSRRTKKLFWRWRNNPLRRRDDVVEAWVVLLVWAVTAVGGAVAGLVTAHAATEVFDRQRVERHSVRAVLLDDTAGGVVRAGAGDDRITARVRWTDADGAVRTGEALVDTGLKAGARTTVWVDARGRIVTEPPSRGEAAVEAGFLAAAAGLGFAGLALGAGGVVRWRLERRRVDRWGREWDLVGPTWGHKTG